MSCKHSDSGIFVLSDYLPELSVQMPVVDLYDL